SLAELFAKVSEAAAKARPGDVLVSNMDWHEAQLKEVRTPTQAELEKAAPGIPLVLIRGGHTYFLNSTALAKWNITPDTPVPQGGAVPKDASRSEERRVGKRADLERRRTSFSRDWSSDVCSSDLDWHEAQLKEVRTPTQAELEKAAPGIPLVLIRGGHTYFLNSTALAKWNITPDTPVPQGGAVPKDAS